MVRKDCAVAVAAFLSFLLLFSFFVEDVEKCKTQAGRSEIVAARTRGPVTNIRPYRETIKPRLSDGTWPALDEYSDAVPHRGLL